MSFIIVGLGNPGQEYEGTRHNTGRMMLFALAKEIGVVEAGDEHGAAAEFKADKKLKALVARGEIGKGKKAESVTLIAPETFMNKSGLSVGSLVTTGGMTGAKPNLKKAEKLIVIYDDFNLPLGSIRVSFNRSSGGHNGLESIIKAARTPAFVRVRVGVAPEKANGTAKVPHGEKEIEKFILSTFKPTEAAEIKKVAKNVIGAIETIIGESREKAMSIYNAS